MRPAPGVHPSPAGEPGRRAAGTRRVGAANALGGEATRSCGLGRPLRNGDWWARPRPARVGPANGEARDPEPEPRRPCPRARRLRGRTRRAGHRRAPARRASERRAPSVVARVDRPARPGTGFAEPPGAPTPAFTPPELRVAFRRPSKEGMAGRPRALPSESMRARSAGDGGSRSGRRASVWASAAVAPATRALEERTRGKLRSRRRFARLMRRTAGPTHRSPESVFAGPERLGGGAFPGRILVSDHRDHRGKRDQRP